MVTLLTPGGDRLAVEDDDLEERVEEEDPVGIDRGDVEEDGHWRPVERVREEGRLDHDERVGARLAAEEEAVVARLVGAVTEDLEELRAAEVEHELRVDRKGRREAEGGGVVLAVVSELGHEACGGHVSSAAWASKRRRARRRGCDERETRMGSRAVDVGSRALWPAAGFGSRLRFRASGSGVADEGASASVRRPVSRTDEHPINPPKDVEGLLG